MAYIMNSKLKKTGAGRPGSPKPKPPIGTKPRGPKPRIIAAPPRRKPSIRRGY